MPFDDAFGVIFTQTNLKAMSLLNNNKKGNEKQKGNNKNVNSNNSKFIKSSSKSPNVTKKVRSTGANRGS